ncbi:hypothetical protein V6N13_108364 [Hibiscus sabdariffa]|uniref:Uncharacterized protein n=1 Tax=Hibiscus sabdariffa TaxID=183260 RepID=A0ABR2SSR1_9ROSI
MSSYPGAFYESPCCKDIVRTSIQHCLSHLYSPWKVLAQGAKAQEKTPQKTDIVSFMEDSESIGLQIAEDVFKKWMDRLVEDACQTLDTIHSGLHLP